MRSSDWSSDVCSSDLAVAPVVIAADRKGDSVTDRAGDVALDDDRVIIAVARLERAAEVEPRLLGDDADDARRRILAEQRRLRAAQHLDPFDVRQVADLAGRARTEGGPVGKEGGSEWKS